MVVRRATPAAAAAAAAADPSAGAAPSTAQLVAQRAADSRNTHALDLSCMNLATLPPAGVVPGTADLDLNHNRLGAFPVGICVLAGTLRRLDLSFNRLGVIDAHIGRLVNLEQLHLAGNALTELPSSIGYLQKLSILHADHNKIVRLPAALARCSALSVLKLSSNELTHLPACLVALRTHLGVLDVRLNPLRSPPRAIARDINAIWDHLAAAPADVRAVPAVLDPLPDLVAAASQQPPAPLVHTSLPPAGSAASGSVPAVVPVSISASGLLALQLSGTATIAALEVSVRAAAGLPAGARFSVLFREPAQEHWQAVTADLDVAALLQSVRGGRAPVVAYRARSPT